MKPGEETSLRRLHPESTADIRGQTAKLRLHFCISLFQRERDARHSPLFCALDPLPALSHNNSSSQPSALRQPSAMLRLPWRCSPKNRPPLPRVRSLAAASHSSLSTAHTSARTSRSTAR